MTKDGLKTTTYGTNQVFIEQGWYSKEWIEKLLEAIKRQEKHTKEMMGNIDD